MLSNCLVFHTSGGISSSPAAFLFLIFLRILSVPLYICLLIDIVPFLVLRHLCLLGFFDSFWRLFSLVHVFLSPLKFPMGLYI